MKLYADGGYKGPLFRRAVAKIMARVNVEIIKAFRSRKRICRPPKAVGRRTNVRMARAVQASRQRLGEYQSKSACISASSFNQAHAEKTMQSRQCASDSRWLKLGLTDRRAGISLPARAAAHDLRASVFDDGLQGPVCASAMSHELMTAIRRTSYSDRDKICNFKSSNFQAISPNSRLAFHRSRARSRNGPSLLPPAPAGAASLILPD